MITEEAVKKMLLKIVENRELPVLNWAVNYAREGLLMTGEALRIQCLYILNNMTSWRGVIAKEVRAVLKEFTKQKD